MIFTFPTPRQCTWYIGYRYLQSNIVLISFRKQPLKIRDSPFSSCSRNEFLTWRRNFKLGVKMRIVGVGMQRRRCNVIFEEKWNLSAVQLPKAWECLSAVPSGGMPACCREMLSLHGLKKWRFHLRSEKSRSTKVIRSFNISARKKLNLNDTLNLHFYSIRNWKGF